MGISMQFMINGVPGGQVDINDRGLLYGDGVFRTLRVQDRLPLQWQRHYLKLQQDCNALNMPCPADALLLQELRALTQQQPECIVKIIITRGAGQRGYAPPLVATPTRILSLSPVPQYPAHFYSEGVTLKVCALRLAQQPRLAGIKHLNRLEHVLAAAECDEEGIADGVLLDTSDLVVETTSSNLFAVYGATLVTPDLTRCGVAGVQRERVLEWAAKQGLECQIRDLELPEMMRADEMFLVNSVIGLWPIRALQDRVWYSHKMALQIQGGLDHAHD